MQLISAEPRMQEWQAVWQSLTFFAPAELRKKRIGPTFRLAIAKPRHI